MVVIYTRCLQYNIQGQDLSVVRGIIGGLPIKDVFISSDPSVPHFTITLEQLFDKVGNLIQILAIHFHLHLFQDQPDKNLFNQWQCSTLVMSQHPSGRLD